jgi:peptide-methionine (S)-S-oxide reductase
MIDDRSPPMFSLMRKKSEMVTADTALPGRTTAIPTATTHFIFDRPLAADVPQGMEEAMFGMGCFWGVERKFWQVQGVYLTMVGYAAGFTPNPTYKETCTQMTGHNEVVRVIFDPKIVTYEALLKLFWEGHDPTQGMRQGNDVGSTYRSGIYTYSAAQAEAAQATKAVFAERLRAAGYGAITTEIIPAPVLYFAEDYHQQYLAKNPDGYCGIGGTGVTCPIGVGVQA